MVQLSHPYMTTGKTIALAVALCIAFVISAPVHRVFLAQPGLSVQMETLGVHLTASINWSGKYPCLNNT